VILPDGSEAPSQSVEFLRKAGYENHFEKMGRIFAAAGILRTGRVGDAAITNARIRDIVNVAAGYVQRDPCFLVSP
jgi:hypothetical protein